MPDWKFSLKPTAVKFVETRFRRIVTQIPVPESLPLLRSIEETEARSMHGQLPMVWDRAEGFQIHDPWGNTWIDFTSSIFLANVGHGHPRIVAAIRQQLDKPLLHSYTYLSQVRADYLRYLIDQTPDYLEKAFLLSAGTEATECALKLMRLDAGTKGKRRAGVITFEGNFHGRTQGAQMMTGNAEAKAWVGYHDPNTYHLPFPYPWLDQAHVDARAFFDHSIERLLSENEIDPDKDLCGFMLETFQGWGAVFYPKAYIDALVDFAKRHNLLVVFDEMQAGFGRTGKLFGYMHYGVEPDLVCCGKGISSSVALSAVLGRKELLDLPGFGSMSSTNSANPIACAAGLANLKVLIEEDLIEQSRRLGEIFFARLNALQQRHPQHIRHVLGQGLLAGVLFLDEKRQPLGPLCTTICEEALRRGLILVHTGRESIKLGPPLSISEDALKEGLDVFSECVSDSIKQHKGQRL